MMSKKGKQQVSKLKFTEYALKLDSITNVSDSNKILKSLEFIRKNILFKLKDFFDMQSDKEEPEQEVRTSNIENIRNKLQYFIAKAKLEEVIGFMLQYGKKGEVTDAISIHSAFIYSSMAPPFDNKLSFTNFRAKG